MLVTNSRPPQTAIGSRTATAPPPQMPDNVVPMTPPQAEGSPPEEKDHYIAWESKIDGRTGVCRVPRGKNEAIQLANELNNEHPKMLHTPIPIEGAPPEPAKVRASPKKK